jgi:DNA-binding transcriptional ArsR family regulator
MPDLERLYDAGLAKALSHPLRARILERLEHQTASPSELAQQLAAPLGNVSYHVRILAEAGLIELVRTTRRRGATEHHYRAAATRPVVRHDGRDLTIQTGPAAEAAREPEAPGYPDEATEEHAGETTLDPVREAVAEIRRHAHASAGEGSVRAHVTRTTLALDDEAWNELLGAVERLHDLALRLQLECAPRLRRAEHKHEREANLLLMLFEGSDPEALRALRGGVGERRHGRTRN